MTSNLILTYAEKAVKSGGIYWFSPEDAVTLLANAQAAGAALLGFDAATVRPGDYVQPSWEDSWDYSGGYPAVPDPYAHAIQFIRDRKAKGLHFEIVLG